MYFLFLFLRSGYPDLNYDFSEIMNIKWTVNMFGSGCNSLYEGINASV